MPSKVVSRARELLAEMEAKNASVSVKADDLESGQISFDSVNRESALDMLERTNIDELTDSECRELLNDMMRIIK